MPIRNNTSTITLNVQDNASKDFLAVENATARLERQVEQSAAAFAGFGTTTGAIAGHMSEVERASLRLGRTAQGTGTAAKAAFDGFGRQVHIATGRIAGMEIAMDRIQTAAQGAGSGVDHFGNEITQAGIVLPRFTNQLNRAAAAQATFQRNTSQLQFGRGGLGNLNKLYKEAEVHTHAFGNTMNVSAFHSANLAAQFNDIGVTLAAGQSPFLIALQQGTQISQVLQVMASDVGIVRALFAGLKSVISPISLITIGVIAAGAALGQWVISAIRAGKETRTLEEVIDDLGSSTSEYQKLIGETAKSHVELEESFGSLVDRGKELLEIQKQLADQKILSNFRSSLNVLQQNFVDFTGGIFGTAGNELFDERFGASGANLLSSIFGDDAREIQDTLQNFNSIYQQLGDLGDLDNIQDAALHFSSLRRNLLRLLGPVDEWTDAQRAAVEQLLEVEEQLARTSAEIEKHGEKITENVRLHPDFAFFNQDAVQKFWDDFQKRTDEEIAEYEEKLISGNRGQQLHPDFAFFNEDAVQEFWDDFQKRTDEEIEEYEKLLTGGDRGERLHPDFAFFNEDAVQKFWDDFQARTDKEIEEYEEKLIGGDRGERLHPDFAFFNEDAVQEFWDDFQKRTDEEVEEYEKKLVGGDRGQRLHPDFAFFNEDAVQAFWDDFQARTDKEIEEYEKKITGDRGERLHPDFAFFNVDAVQEFWDDFNRRSEEGFREFESQSREARGITGSVSDREREVDAVRRLGQSPRERIQEQIDALNKLRDENSAFAASEGEVIVTTEIYDKALAELTRQMEALNIVVDDSRAEQEAFAIILQYASNELDLTRQAFESMEKDHVRLKKSMEDNVATPIERVQSRLKALNLFIPQTAEEAKLLAKETARLKAELNKLARIDGTTNAMNDLKRAFNEGRIGAYQYREQMEALEIQMERIQNPDAVVLNVEARRALRQLDEFEQIWENMARNMQAAFGDLIYDSLFEKGIKSFGDFGEAILNIWKRTIAEMIAAWASSGILRLLSGAGFSGFGGSFLGSAAGSAVGGAVGGGAGGFGLLGAGSLFGSLGAITPGLGAIGGSGFLGGLGAALSPGGFGLTGIGANSLLAGGGIGATIGAALPIFTAGAFILSGLFAKTKVIDQGIKVIVDGTDTLASSFQTVRKSRFFGLVRSTRTNTSPVDYETQAAIEAGLDLTRDQVKTAFENFNLDFNPQSFFGEFKASFQGLNEAARAAKLEELFAEIAMEMSTAALEMNGFLISADQSEDAFARLASAAELVTAAAERAQIFREGRTSAAGVIQQNFENLSTDELSRIRVAAIGRGSRLPEGFYRSVVEELNNRRELIPQNEAIGEILRIADVSVPGLNDNELERAAREATENAFNFLKDTTLKNANELLESSDLFAAAIDAAGINISDHLEAVVDQVLNSINERISIGGFRPVRGVEGRADAANPYDVNLSEIARAIAESGESRASLENLSRSQLLEKLDELTSSLTLNQQDSNTFYNRLLESLGLVLTALEEQNRRRVDRVEAT